MKHIVRITSKPVLSGRQSVPDGALCGNGDLAVILGSCENGMRIYISKCDILDGFESHDKGGLKPLGYIDVPIEKSLYDNYYVEQDLDRFELRCLFSCGERECGIDIRVCGVENSVMIEMRGNETSKPVLKVFGGETSGQKSEFSENGIAGISRIFAGEGRAYDTEVYAFMKELGGGRYYIFAATNHDTEDPKKYAFEKSASIDGEKYDALVSAHCEKWAEIMNKSSFSSPDEELELGWYASQYLIAICTGNKKFPPGLYGNFITVENPAWHSDYHLNYNYQAAFYAACSSNHVEFTDCYHAPLEEFFEKGRKFAAEWGCGGILYPVGIAPKGLCSELTPGLKYGFERLFLGQKSNAIHPADIMVFRWKATRDTDYARDHAYPYIRACLEFFEDWLVFEDGRYSVLRDAAHEVPYYKSDFDPEKYKKYINDKNNALTLGMLRLCIPAAIDMARALKTDEEKCRKWQDIYDCLSPFPTYYRAFRKVFRYTEKGQSWNRGNDVGLQHIYPAGCIGMLTGDRKELKIARNTFRQKEKVCWTDDNAACSFFPMAARLGKDPSVILKKLSELNKTVRLPNMLYDFSGGCLETCPLTANTVNEMLLQSFEGIINVFPCWRKENDVSFKTLRADGAFLVSSEISEGSIRFVEIISEAGETLRIKNPFGYTRVEMSDGRAFNSDEKILSIDTFRGMKLTLLPL